MSEKEVSNATPATPVVLADLKQPSVEDLPGEFSENLSIRPEKPALLKEHLEFLRELNHKLSQPMTSLRFCLEFAILGNEAKKRDSVKDAANLTESLIDLLHAMRELTEALDPGDVQQALDLKSFAKSVLGQLEPSSNFSWKQPQTALVARVCIHPGRLHRALLGLLTEAAADCDAAAPVYLEIEEAFGRVCFVCSYEAGPQARDQARFFLPFSARGSSLDQRALAVAVSQRIAQAAGGQLEFLVEGKNRQLRFSLPAYTDARLV